MQSAFVVKSRCSSFEAPQDLESSDPLAARSNLTARQNSPQTLWLLLGLRFDRAVSTTIAAMCNRTRLCLAKWPFLLADALLLSAAYLIYRQSAPPMGVGQAGLAVLCVAGGACLSIAPYLMEYWVEARLAQARGLTCAEDQFRKLESALAEITALAGQARAAQADVGKTAATARDIAESIAAEVRRFTQRLELMNYGEKPKPELALEKSPPSGDDWLPVLVQVLDHVYALQVGAMRSGQLNLIEQVSHFQDACRSAARRLGLTPFIAEPMEPFDTQRHQWGDGQSPVPGQSTVAETIATGFMFKGRLLRPALVRLMKSPGAETAEGQLDDKRGQFGAEAKAQQ